MGLVHLIVVFCVTSALVALPLYPFWKVWHLLKTRHTDIWSDRGPFDFTSMLASGGLVAAFIETLHDEALMARDDDLRRAATLARSIYSLRPKSFVAQVGYFLVLLYFVGFFTSVIISVTG